jgi:D-alanyl-D-alanine carboxypeptidase-like protein
MTWRRRIGGLIASRGSRLHDGLVSSSLSRIAVAAAIACALVLVWGFASDDLGIVVPDDPCAERPPLRSVAGVRLQPLALRAFRHAERLAGRRIDVVESYRSCRRQAAACKSICGSPGGCPGMCASPGASAHQLGAAVDVTEAMLDQPTVLDALVRAGWCQPLPGSDPGHFSFGGCR